MLLSYIDKKKKGKKNILGLSTIHKQVQLSVDERKKPQTLIFYGHTKGGVDVVDLICAKMSTRMKTRRWTINFLAFLLGTACTNAKAIFKRTTPTKPFSTFQFTWKLGRKLLVRICIQRPHDNHVGLMHSLVNSICKVLGIEQPTERRQKPELLNKGQRCYLYLEEINGQPD